MYIGPWNVAGLPTGDVVGTVGIPVVPLKCAKSSELNVNPGLAA